MATLYVDLISGLDTTGDGSAGNPYLTVNKAVSIAGGPHDIRVAKTTAPTSVTGADFTWTANSVNVGTSADMTASIAVGDYIGKNSAAGNGAEETYYRVNGITNVAITLELKYGGTSAIETNCKKLVVITTGTTGTPSMTLVNNTVLSGGWNLSGTPTQDGETWFKAFGARGTTTSIGIQMSSLVGCNVSKMNPVEVYTLSGTVGSTTITNCTWYANFTYSLQLGAGTTLDGCCLICTSTPLYTTSTYNVINCIFLGGVNGFLINSNVDGTISGCKFISIVGGGLYQNNAIEGTTATNCEFRNCVAGVTLGAASTHIYVNCIFNNCGSGIIGGNNTSYINAYNCTFTNCTTRGVYFAYCHGSKFTNCTFDTCAIGVQITSYSGDMSFYNCSFLTPTSYGVSRESATNGTTYFYGCTIDGASVAKAYQTTTSPYIVRQYVLQNSFGQTGIIQGLWSVMRDNTNYRTSSPCVAISTASSTTLNNVPVKVVSSWARSGVSRTYTMWIKSASGSWAGTITPVWKLGGATIKTESNITSLTTSYVQYSWTVDSSLITSDDELSLHFIPNNNAYSIYCDDFVCS